MMPRPDARSGAGQPPPGASPEDAAAYKSLSLVANPDGSITRINQPPTLPANPDPESDPTAVALSKDVPLNPARNTSIRLFRPTAPPAAGKLPLIIYFHGGGFILLSAATLFFHKSSSRLAARLPAVVASVEYRLAPEHRLPAAYDDAMDAINWAKTEAIAAAAGGCAAAADPWLKELADFSRIFLMGSSAGGNMVYHAALRAVDLDLRPAEIVGLIMNEAFFGGVGRTESEVEHNDDVLVPSHVTDLLWSLALPAGADRGHVYCDAAATAGDERIRRLPASMVAGYTGDPLVDRQRELAKLLEERGVKVTRRFVDGGCHAIELFEKEYSDKLFDDVKDFVCSVGGDRMLGKAAANL
ncbi:probable carboxylesterase 8 [Andrographis paniculata]|uniref:probable carboxylesterase 8 n=1 Tax=Andrographis paniculata TaxID=175694 RepID=UPI0021E98AD2|nr:probable carboxylesterase 8 [Andrographis paniculata]